VSIRAQLYEAIAKLTERDPVARIAATGEFLDSLSAEEAEVAARKLLALTIAYGADDMTKSKATLDEFFDRVDVIEKTLLN
jgi:hypothetical protein